MSRALRVLTVLSLACAALVACSPEDDPTLRPEEQRLVDEALRLMTVRIETARDARRGEQIREELGPVYSEEELTAILESLSQDSTRGHRVMAAIHESLQVMRPRLFPAEAPPPDPQAVRIRTPGDPE